MKATKKIVGAACALVAAVALSAGSTFAWFVSNPDVTAKGIQIQVNANATYLLIGSGDNNTASAIQGLVASGGGTETTISSNNATVLPSAHKNTVTSYATAETVGNWYTAKGTSATDGTAVESSKTDLTTFTGYVIKNTVYLTTVPGTPDTGAITTTVTLENVGTATDHNAVTVLLACDDTVIEYIYSGSAYSWVSSKNTITTGVTSSDVKTIDIYVYYNGDYGEVTTNKAAQLSGAKVEVKFTAANAS